MSQTSPHRARPVCGDLSAFVKSNKLNFAITWQPALPGWRSRYHDTGVSATRTGPFAMWPDWCSEPSRNEGSVHSLARPADCAADIRDKGGDRLHETSWLWAIPRSRLTGLALLLCKKAVVFVAFDTRSKISTNRQAGQRGPSWLSSCNTGINWLSQPSGWIRGPAQLSLRTYFSLFKNIVYV